MSYQPSRLTSPGLHENLNFQNEIPNFQLPLMLEECPLFISLNRITQTGLPSKESPVVQLESPEFRKPKINFLVSPGSDANLIKLCALNPELTLATHKWKEITGITIDKLTTLGTIQIRILKSTVEFHVVRNSFPISTHGILGKPYLRQEQAHISFRHNALFIISDPVTPISFVDEESLNAKQFLKSELKSLAKVLRIKARTRQPIAINIINPELREGYLPKIKAPSGIYIGEALVSNEYGTCRTVAINISEKDIDLEITPQELFSFEFWRFPSKKSTNLVSEVIQNQFDFHFERVLKVKKAFQLSHLNHEQKKIVFKWAEDYTDLFYANEEKHNFSSFNPYGIPTVDEKISPKSSLRLIIPKGLENSSERKYRVVTDYRTLNENFEGNISYLPTLTTVCNKLSIARFFSAFELVRDFNEPDSVFNNGSFQRQRVSMGIKHAPTIFQRLLNIDLSTEIGSEAYVYLNKFIIYTTTLEEHDRQARRIFDKFRETNLKIQIDKCDILKPELAYLEHIIDKNGVKPDPCKVKLVKNFPIPTTQKEISTFLGLLEPYRHFIRDYSKQIRPLAQLLKKDAKWKWGVVQKKNFEKLRKCLYREPFLPYPDFRKNFKLTTNATQHTIGAILMQEDNGIDLPISYYSKILNDKEQKYSKAEKECLAILCAIDNFRAYLHDKIFSLACISEPIHCISCIKNPGERLLKWKLQLQNYTYKFESRVENQFSSASSKLYNETCSRNIPRWRYKHHP